MPISSSDIQYRLSGGAANSDQNASLGGAKSSSSASSAIFDDVSSAESAAGDTEYRCVYVHNNHGSLSMQNTVIWIQANTPSATTDVAIALGGEGLNGTAETVANESTAPSGETFSSPSSEGAGLSLGTIPFGQHYPVWIRRTVTAGTAAAADSFTLRVKCDTAA
jgi:hypothetical protein